jgi:hypothetical protein
MEEDENPPYPLEMQAKAGLLGVLGQLTCTTSLHTSIKSQVKCMNHVCTHNTSRKEYTRRPEQSLCWDKTALV